MVDDYTKLIKIISLGGMISSIRLIGRKKVNF
jgi:hypothetical protein